MLTKKELQRVYARINKIDFNKIKNNNSIGDYAADKAIPARFLLYKNAKVTTLKLAHKSSFSLQKLINLILI